MSNHIHLTNEASKGQSGRVIALNKELRKQLIKVKQINGVGITDADRSSHTAMPGCDGWHARTPILTKRKKHCSGSSMTACEP
jgi:hypothetical protein